MPLAFVTGAGDFVGLNLIEALLANGWDVVGLASKNDHTGYLDHFGIDYSQGDVGSLATVRKAMPERADAVFHAVHHVSLWSREAEEQTRVNVKGTQAVVRIAIEKKARRFIHTSSIVAYGLHAGTVTEETPSKASSSNINFVRSKGQAEQIVKKACRNGLSAVIINPSNMIGPYDFNGWARLFRLVRKRRMPIMAAGGGSFCHSQAMARAQLAAVEQGKTGHNYLLGGQNVTYLTLLQEIGRRLNRRSLPRALPTSVLRSLATVDERLSGIVGARPTMTRETIELLAAQTYCQSTRAQKDLGYEPVSLDKMLEDCHAWLEAEGLI